MLFRDILFYKYQRNQQKKKKKKVMLLGIGKMLKGGTEQGTAVFLFLFK